MEKVMCDVASMAFIKNAVDTAELVGVDSMLFRPGIVSGIGGKTGMSVVMLHEHQTPLSFDVLGVMQPKDLKVRLNLIELKADAIELSTVQERIDDDPTMRRLISSMTLKSGRMKITYAAGSPKAIRAPRRISFNEAHQLPLDTSTVHASLTNATRALLCDADTTVALSANRGELIASVQDRNNDVYEDVVSTLGDSAAFSHRYILNYFLPLIKAHTNSVPVVISKEGLLKFNINGFTVYQLPKV